MKLDQVHFFLTKLDQVHFWQGRSTFGRKKWTPWSIFFCQNWTGRPFFSRSTFGMTGLKNSEYTEPKSKQVHFWQEKKWTRSSFSAEIQAGPFLARDPVQFCCMLKSRQVHFCQGIKVDLVQFCCQNLGRSIFGKGKKWTQSSFTAEI